MTFVFIELRRFSGQRLSLLFFFLSSPSTSPLLPSPLNGLLGLAVHFFAEQPGLFACYESYSRDQFCLSPSLFPPGPFSFPGCRVGAFRWSRRVALGMNSFEVAFLPF